MERRAAGWTFAAAVVAMLATTLTPPLLRMYSTEIWRYLGWTEVGWSVFLAAKGLFLIVFVLAAGELVGIKASAAYNMEVVGRVAPAR